MTLPASGPISLNNVNVELGLSGTTLISLNQASVRTLAGVPSGAISMSNLYGKSNRTSLSITYTSSTYTGQGVFITSQPGYVAGKTDLTITVDYGVWLASGMSIVANNPGDTVTIINRGVIAGVGGNGGSAGFNSGAAGSNAISLNGSSVFTIDNTYASAWIAGGGGGGAGGNAGGGGGAGGGAGGGGTFGGGGGAGGLIGASGDNGAGSSPGRAGGGGGRILPGVGGASGDTGNGGGAGGSGGGYFAPEGEGSLGGAGGSANNPGAAGGTGIAGGIGGGGGGGWGAAGGSNGGYPGGAGGKAVYLNGASVTFVSGDTSRVYGAVGS